MQTERPPSIYQLSETHEILYLPVLRPQGPGGNPGRGTSEAGPSKVGGTIRIPRNTIVSNPPRPDNRRQTVQQSLAPPELRIPFEVRIPNILLVKTDPLAPPPVTESPRVRLSPSSVRLPERRRPVRVPRAERPQIPDPSEVAAEWNLASIPEFPNPALPVPPPPMPEPLELGTGEDPLAPLAGSIDLLAISVDPGPLSLPPAVPPGNREGAFAITPDAGEPGAAGGTAVGGSTVGTDDAAAGGDRSAAGGSGTSGGGGGATAAGGSVSMNGNREGDGRVNLPDSVPADWIFPVASSPATPTSGILVSTGPIGGGGLGVYGVLRGGRIATVYVRMERKSWILQYSPISETDSIPEPTPGRVTARFRDNLTPPWPEKKFGFRWPVITAKRGNHLIILHGRIQQDGTVTALRVHRGVQTDADRIALSAFSRWIFRPATRGGKPIDVDVLLGIPVPSGESVESKDSEGTRTE